MIRRACYVACDRCGDPAEVSVEGVDSARAHARQQGFKPVGTRPDAGRAAWMPYPGGAVEDVCPRCLLPDDDIKRSATEGKAGEDR